MSKRSYSDEEKANALLALQANGGNVLRTATETGIPWSTLKEWKAGNHTVPAVTEIREGNREPLAERFEALVHQCLDLLPEKMEQEQGKDLAVVAGIAVDKMRLLREQPTTIHREEPVPDEERIGDLVAVFDAARARARGEASPGTAVN